MPSMLEERKVTKKLVETILTRRSIRKYTSEPVSKDDVKTILEAAMAAPSASNLKPWHFVVVTDKETLNNLAEAHPHGKMLSEAPLCIAVCGDLAISESFWVQDCSASTENLLLAATALNLGSVWLGVYPRQDRVNNIREVLKLPETVVPLNLVSIGHPAEKKEPRTQYDEQKVHLQQW
jgi:nitroreductase